MKIHVAFNIIEVYKISFVDIDSFIENYLLMNIYFQCLIID